MAKDMRRQRLCLFGEVELLNLGQKMGVTVVWEGGERKSLGAVAQAGARTSGVYSGSSS